MNNICLSISFSEKDRMSLYPDGCYIVGCISEKPELTRGAVTMIKLRNDQIIKCSAEYLKMCMQYLIYTGACCLEEQQEGYDFMLVTGKEF